MKFALLPLALLAAAALFWHCKASKHQADKLPAKQIRWGSGGGFTGKTTTFALLENGQIFKTNSLDNSTAEVAGTKAKTARSLFASANSLELTKVNFDHPGNMTYFLEIRDETLNHRIAWGDDKYAVDQKAKDFFNVLQQLVAETGK